MKDSINSSKEITILTSSNPNKTELTNTSDKCQESPTSTKNKLNCSSESWKPKEGRLVPIRKVSAEKSIQWKMKREGWRKKLEVKMKGSGITRLC